MNNTFTIICNINIYPKDITFDTSSTMFYYNEDNPEIILSCSFEGVNISDLDPHEIFQE